MDNIKLFNTIPDWESWLEANHGQFEGIWLMIAKKGSGKTTVTYLEALHVALCYGWIDGQVKTYDQQYYIQKFTPRRAKSLWSKLNVERAERLIKEGKMKPAGLKAIEKAKADGIWDAAYDPGSKMTIPDDFMQELQKNKKASDFFKTLDKTNLFAIGFRLQTARKPETREKRMREIIEMLEKGKKFH
jgi:uncharacterized protein YdeI (YjbR/CyaY-like superfamily)